MSLQLQHVASSGGTGSNTWHGDNRHATLIVSPAREQMLGQQHAGRLSFPWVRVVYQTHGNAGVGQ